MSANETQVGGQHYQTTYQHWDWCIEALNNRYLEGQVTKYVARWRKKNGLQDLEKAAHFLQKLNEAYIQSLVSAIGAGRGAATQTHVAACTENFCVHNNLTGTERKIMQLMANWRTSAGLIDAAACLEDLMHEARSADKQRVTDGG